MKRSSRKVVKWLFLGFILLIPIGMCWIIATHPVRTGGRLERSRRLPATQGLTYDSGCRQGYTWLNAGTVRQVDSVWKPALVVKDTDVETGITQTTASFARGKETGFLAEQLTHLSPDRNWVLFTGSNANTLMRVTGRPLSYQIPFDRPSGTKQSTSVPFRAAWMQDSLHWIEFSNDIRGNGTVLVHAIGGRTPKRIVLPPMPPLPGAESWQTLVGVTERNTALIEEGIRKKGRLPYLRFMEVDLNTGQSAANAALNQLPPLTKGVWDTPVLSPRGDRIVWVMREYPDMLTVLARMLHRKPQTIRDEVFSCRIDGSHLSLADSMECGHREEISMVDWLPDGKRISFVYDKTLYTAPAD
jgi:hypothetical protein